MAGERKVKVRVEVLRGASRWPVLTVDDTRVAGPKCGPYKVVETFMVDRDDLVSALRLEPAPAPPQAEPAAFNKGGSEDAMSKVPQAEPAPEANGRTCPECNGTEKVRAAGHGFLITCPACTGRAGRGER